MLHTHARFEETTRRSRQGPRPPRCGKLARAVRLAFISLLFLGPASNAAFADGRAYVLALQGDGSATVVLDDGSSTAFIHDGGRAETKGVAGATIEGRPVLTFLLEKGITNLVISCSHPHEDHMGGLKTLIQSPEIKQFGQLYFVDAIGPGAKTKSGKQILPLRKIYEARWGNAPPPAIHSASARNADGFAGLNVPVKDVRARTFKYDPADVGTEIHDSSVILEYEVKDGSGATRTIVDFDDASTALVDHWTNSQSPRKIDAILMSHHGSRHNDMTSVLNHAQKRFGLTDVIFTANKANRFRHPTPEALEMAIKAVGPDHVHITGSSQGDAVEIGATGELVRSTPGRARSRLEAFVATRVAENEYAIRHSQSAAQALKLHDDLKAMERIQVSLQSASGRDRRHANGVTDYLILMAGVTADQSFDDSGGPGAGGGGGRPGGPSGPDSTRGSGSPGGGGPGPNEPSGNRGPGRPSGNHPGGNVGRPSARYGSGGSTTRYANYRSVSRPGLGLLRFGGIVIGEKPKGPPIRAVALVPGEKSETASIEIETTGDERAVFGPVSATELWVAYNYVKPSEGLKARYPGIEIEPDAGGLVGKVDEAGTKWKFALHPAIADTALAGDAMRVDMAVFAATSDPEDELPDVVEKLPWTKIDDYLTYQWFDAPAEIVLGGGQVSIRAVADRRPCIMRLRLIQEPNEAQLLGSIKVGDRDPELVRLVNQRKEGLARLFGERPSDEHLKIIRELERDALKEKRAVARELRGMSGHKDVSRDDRVVLEEIALERIAQKAEFPSKVVSADVTGALCEGLPFLQRIDRVAKLVALFHLYLDTSGKDLPALPSELVPRFVDVDADLGPEAVWDELVRTSDTSSSGLVPSRADPPRNDRGPTSRSNGANGSEDR